MSIMTQPAAADQAVLTAAADFTAPARHLTDDDVEPLKWFLYDRRYAMVERFRILDCAAATRTLADVVANGTLDREDEEDAYEVLLSCFPPLGNDPWDWDTFSEGDRWTTGPPIPRTAVLCPPDLDLDFENSQGWPGGDL